MLLQRPEIEVCTTFGENTEHCAFQAQVDGVLMREGRRTLCGCVDLWGEELRIFYRIDARVDLSAHVTGRTCRHYCCLW